MTKRTTPLGQFEPRCELCGTPAPPLHGSPRQGSFVEAQPTGDVGTIKLWACASCIPKQHAFGPMLLNGAQNRVFTKLRAELGTVADRLVDVSTRSQSSDARSSAPTGLRVEDLAAWHLLDSVKGLGPQAAHAIHAAGLSPSQVIAEPSQYPQKGKRADKVVAGIRAIGDRERQAAHQFAESQLHRASELGATIIGYNDPDYPPLVRASNNPIPILWVRGNKAILRSEQAVACVGSRGIRSPYAELQAAFVDAAVEAGFVISSGFAMGADSIGHLRALEAGGHTVCVMPCGVDLVFPPENRDLWNRLLDSEQAVFISEFAFGRRAESLTLRKRNKLIVAAARGVLVGQTSTSGGAMNAYKFGLEQKKPVATFEPDGTDDTSGNKEIKESDKGRTLAFPSTPARDEYRRWLTELSSSI